MKTIDNTESTLQGEVAPIEFFVPFHIIFQKLTFDILKIIEYIF